MILYKRNNYINKRLRNEGKCGLQGFNGGESGRYYNVYLPLADAAFDIVNKDTNEVVKQVTSGADGSIDLDGYVFDATVNYGPVETKAAPGHKLPTEEISKIVVTAEQLHLTKVFYNEVQHLPVTGSALTLLLMSLAILLTVAGDLIIYKSRKEDKQESGD